MQRVSALALSLLALFFNDLINLNFYILSHILLLLTIGTLFSQKKETEEKPKKEGEKKTKKELK